MSEQPAASVNAGFSAAGMPIGLADRPAAATTTSGAAPGPRVGAYARAAAPLARGERDSGHARAAPQAA